MLFSAMRASGTSAHAFADEVIEQAATQLAVFVRPATLADSDHLIHLNQAFRYEMAQWEAGLGDGDEDEGYPVLDYDDVEFILTKEDPSNLIVLGRRLENEERIIGYSYSYAEPWESAVSVPARRTRTGATPRKQPPVSRTARCDQAPESLYLAELFIAEQERGLGLGELLLTGTLHARKCDGLSSHLFVSSKNVSAVKCYMKFGYDRGTRPSGDAAHDLVMEMRSCTDGVARSVERLSEQLLMGTIGARRRRKPAALAKKDKDKEKEKEKEGAVGASPTFRTDSRSASTESFASTVENVSRASSRSTIRASPPPQAVKPRVLRPTRGAHSAEAMESGPIRRRSRQGDRDSLELGSASIQGRQRKPLRAMADKGETCSKRPARANTSTSQGPSADPHAAHGGSDAKLVVTRRMKRPKFMLTGMRTSQVANAKSVISRLSAEVIDSDFYDPSATHVIAPRALRTEKFLCALAAGKHLLKAGYIQDCDSAGRLLPEQGYEWEEGAGVRKARHLFSQSSRLRSSAAAPPSLSGKLRSCAGSPTKANAFSCTGAAGTGCFAGISAMLLIGPEKKECFRRVLDAGSAMQNSGCSSAVDVTAVTHAFVSRDLLDPESDGWTDGDRRAALKQLEELHNQGVPCFYDNLIVDFLTGLEPKPEEYRVVEERARPVRGDKRKAAGPACMEHVKKTRMTLLQPSH